jgi:hypothetical protein
MAAQVKRARRAGASSAEAEACARDCQVPERERGSAALLADLGEWFDERRVPRYPSMVSSERPDGSEREDRDRERVRRLEGILPELVKRVFEAGYERLSEGPESVRHFMSELRLPKDVLSQLDETKNGIYRAVAKEVRDFLDHTNFADELANVLTKLSFEVKTEVRFIPNDAAKGARPIPDVKAKVSLKRDRSSRPPESRTDIDDKASHASDPLANGQPNEESQS